jgi:hypothetical protein
MPVRKADGDTVRSSHAAAAPNSQGTRAETSTYTPPQVGLERLRHVRKRYFATESSYAFSEAALLKSAPCGAAEAAAEEVRSENM